MKESVFIDSGFWISLFDFRDKNHIAAKKDLKPLLRDYQVYTSDFINFETITYLKCSLKRHDLAIQFLANLQNSRITVLRVDERAKSNALDLFKKYSDKFYSFTDCSSFILMFEKNIQKYAGFDEHFRQMGFLPVLI